MNCCENYHYIFRYKFCPECGNKIELSENERELKCIDYMKKYFCENTLLYTINLFQETGKHRTDLTYDIKRLLCKHPFGKYDIKEFEKYKSYYIEFPPYFFNKLNTYFKGNIKIIKIKSIYYVIKHECVNAYIDQFEILDENEYFKLEKSKIKYFDKWYKSFNNDKYKNSDVYLIFEDLIYKSYFDPNCKDVGELKEECMKEYLEYENIKVKK